MHPIISSSRETCIFAKQLDTRRHQPDPCATKPVELILTDLARLLEPLAKDGFGSFW